MNKEELLQELSTKVSVGEISREEVMNRLNILSVTQREDGGIAKILSHLSVTKMLYVLGAAIVIIGIIIFIAQIWGNVGSFGRISITLGLGFLITAIGSVLLKQKPEDNIGAIFHFIGGVLVPGGAIVTLFEIGGVPDSIWTLVILSGVLFTFYLTLSFVHKNAVLTFFAIANGTAFIYLLAGAIITDSNLSNKQQIDVLMYLTMAIGASYLFLTHTFREGWNKYLVGILYFFGITGLLSATFYQVFDSVLWQMFYFIIVTGGLFLSVYMKSRIILVISTLFLVAHVSYITGKYFANSLGWPISLVILGFMFIGLGYASITINKRYIQKS